MDRNLRLTEIGRRRAKIALFRKMLVPFLVFEAILLGVLVFFMRPSLLQFIVILGLALLILLVFAFRTWMNPVLSFRDWGLHVGEDSIYLTDDPDRRPLRRGEIGSLVESADGLVVKARGAPRRIWIPAGIEDYDNLRRTLEAWMRSET